MSARSYSDTSPQPIENCRRDESLKPKFLATDRTCSLHLAGTHGLRDRALDPARLAYRFQKPTTIGSNRFRQLYPLFLLFGYRKSGEDMQHNADAEVLSLPLSFTDSYQTRLITAHSKSASQGSCVGQMYTVQPDLISFSHGS